MQTVDFYEQNAAKLIDRYNAADMTLLHKLLLEYIPPKSAVFDIGFGSGRDLQFLYDNGYEVWGVDPSDRFVKNAQRRFPDINSHFIRQSLPFNPKSIGLQNKFDAVMSVAVWMHLKHELYEGAVETIAQLTKTRATVVISFSQGNRGEDERYFEEVDREYLTSLFAHKDYKLVKTTESKDSLNRDSLTWITVIYRHD